MEDVQKTAIECCIEHAFHVIGIDFDNDKVMREKVRNFQELLLLSGYYIDNVKGNLICERCGNTTANHPDGYRVCMNKKCSMYMRC